MWKMRRPSCNTATTYCNTLQHAATHSCVRLSPIFKCYTYNHRAATQLEHTATRYDTLRHIHTCDYRPFISTIWDLHAAKQLQHTATCCDTLQHNHTCDCRAHSYVQHGTSALQHNYRKLPKVATCWNTFAHSYTWHATSALQDTATSRCNTLQHAATHVYLQQSRLFIFDIRMQHDPLILDNPSPPL